MNKTITFYDIGHIRNEINVIDEKLVSLINDRARMAILIGKEKHTQKMIVYDKSREKSIIERVKKFNKEKGAAVGESNMAQIIKLVIRACRKAEKKHMSGIKKGEEREREKEYKKMAREKQEIR
jgi:chorismate mutase